MMGYIDLKVLTVNQPIGEFYVSVIKSSELVKLAKTYYLEMDKNEKRYVGNQRPLKDERIPRIKKYLQYTNAAFPNAIILNISEKNFKKIDSNTISVLQSPNTFSVIDGQHRLRAFVENDIQFDLIAVIFVGLVEEKQAELFSTINSEQVKVSPSIRFELKAHDVVKTPEVAVYELSRIFTLMDNSPWKEMISFGVGKDQIYSPKKIITLASFGKTIVDLIYDDSFFFELKDDFYKYIKDRGMKKLEKVSGTIDFAKYEPSDKVNSFFWYLYSTDQESTMYKILKNYFDCFKNVFPFDWGNQKSVLCKTTGYAAMMRLFRDICIKSIENDYDFSYDFFYTFIKKISPLSDRFADNYYGAGEKYQEKLYKDMLKLSLGIVNDKIDKFTYLPSES